MSNKTKSATKAPRKSRAKAKTPAALSPLPTANITARRIGEAKADVSSYVRCKTAAGHTSLNNGDQVAKRLQGKELEEVYKLVARETDLPLAGPNGLKARYGHLNPGMQKMNLSNVLRGAMRAADAA